MARTSTTIATLHASTGSTTLVLVVLLSALGVTMVLTAVWLIRVTRSDAPALAPLEAMGTRRWARADEDSRTALLAGARPAGAFPPAPIVPYGDDESEAEPVATPPASQPDAAGEPVEVVVADAEPLEVVVVEADAEPVEVVEAEPDADAEPVEVVETDAEPVTDAADERVVADEPALEPEPDTGSQPVIEPPPSPVAPDDREAAASTTGHASHVQEPVAAPDSS